MQRITIQPRAGFQGKLEQQGLSFHSWDNYWKEDVCYRLTAAQVDELEAAAEELHLMYLTAAKFAVAQGRLGQLGIPEPFWPLIERSLRDNEFTLYGRFDFAYDGVSPPKLLEYNADTPTSLLESAVCQWYWMEDVFPGKDQFNSLHERLVSQWKMLGKTDIHIASLKDNEEDWVCSTYLADTALQAGLNLKHIAVEDIGWDEKAQTFVDQENQPIDCLFKLYPWEWMMRDEFGKKILQCKTQFIEPIWKSLLACKGLLPILWEIYPGHKNLLPAYFEEGKLDSFAKKPLFSREGANVELHRNGVLLAKDDGPYGGEGYIYQGLYDMPNFDGRYPVIGAWIVGSQSAGICIREDKSPITTNMSNFVPHYFEA